MTSEELEEFKNEDFKSIDFDALREIDNIRVNISEDKTSRILKFLEGGQNPYIFKHGDVKIKCSFSENGHKIEEQIERYLVGFLQE